MAIKKVREPDGFCPYFLDTKDGLAYITFQLEGDITKIVWAKPPKGKAKAVNKFVEREITERKHQEKHYE